MRWGLVGICVLACACGSSKKKRELQDEPVAEDGTKNAVKSVDEAPESPAAPTPAPMPPVAAPRVSVKADAIEAWLATQPEDAKRVPAKELPDEVRASLLELSKGLAPGKKGVRVRWARALGSVGVAFSYRHRRGEYESRGNWFAVATAYPERGEFGVHSTAFGYQTEGNNFWGFGKSRDIDGDGVHDTVVTYRTSISGGGEDSSSGLILLGSRGGALDVELASRDADWETEGECMDNQHEPLFACWTTRERRPLFLAVIADEDACTNTVRSRTYLAVRAHDDGTLGFDDLFAHIEARGSAEELAKRYTDAIVVQPPEPDKLGHFHPPTCGAGPLILPFESSHVLIREITPTRPEEPWLLFHVPGHGAGVANVARLGEKGDYEPKPPSPDKRAAEIAPGGKRVEMIADDGAIIVGTLWSTNDENQTTAILVPERQYSRYEWLFIADMLTRPYSPSPDEVEPPRARVLAIDLRGCGESTRTVAGGTLDSGDFRDADWKEAVRDVRAAIAYARSIRPKSDVALVGAGLGATLVTLAAADDAEILRLGLISPRIERLGIDITSAYRKVLARTKEAPFGPLLIYGADDADAKTMHEKLGGDSRRSPKTGAWPNLLGDKDIRAAIHDLVVSSD